MAKKIYYDLREQLDQYSVGFPATESGVELRILEKLFTEEEAELYLSISMMLETPESISQRTGKDLKVISAMLEKMFDKGLIFRQRKGDGAKYGAVPFVVGSFEYQLKNMDKEFAELFEQYFTEALGPEGLSKSSPLRTIPVNKSLNHSWPVVPYEDMKKIFESRDKIAVASCICRSQQHLLEKGCDKPLETCFQFGSHADFYVDKGMARYIEKDEAISILEKCEEEGLVPQPFVSQDAGGMCNCCGDCCGILRSIKMHPKPAEKVLSNYYAAIDDNACSACETCLDRCQMDAITIINDSAQVDRDRCIGCGLCVTTCPGDAITLNMKPESDRRIPPASAKEYIMQLAHERGKSLIPISITRTSKE
jgi:Fe-S-cluster-containing hydrogenase component 2